MPRLNFKYNFLVCVYSSYNSLRYYAELTVRIGVELSQVVKSYCSCALRRTQRRNERYKSKFIHMQKLKEKKLYIHTHKRNAKNRPHPQVKDNFKKLTGKRKWSASSVRFPTISPRGWNPLATPTPPSHARGFAPKLRVQGVEGGENKELPMDNDVYAMSSHRFEGQLTCARRNVWGSSRCNQHV